MKQRHFFVFFFSLFFGLSAQASDWKHYLDLTFTSYHFNRNRNYNEFNPGIGYEGVYGVWRILIGGYYNSFNRLTIYTVAGITPLNISITHNTRISAGAVLGAASGYQEFDHAVQTHREENLGLIPVIGLLLTWEPIQPGRFGVNFLVLPPMNKYDVSGFAGVQAKISF